MSISCDENISTDLRENLRELNDALSILSALESAIHGGQKRTDDGETYFDTASVLDTLRTVREKAVHAYCGLIEYEYEQKHGKENYEVREIHDIKALA